MAVIFGQIAPKLYTKKKKPLSEYYRKNEYLVHQNLFSHIFPPIPIFWHGYFEILSEISYLLSCFGKICKKKKGSLALEQQVRIAIFRMLKEER